MIQSTNKNTMWHCVKLKYVLQTCLLLGICLWLIYQLKQQPLERDNARASTRGNSYIVSTGRKGLYPLSDGMGKTETIREMGDDTEMEDETDEETKAREDLACEHRQECHRGAEDQEREEMEHQDIEDQERGEMEHRDIEDQESEEMELRDIEDQDAEPREAERADTVDGDVFDEHEQDEHEPEHVGVSDDFDAEAIGEQRGKGDVDPTRFQDFDVEDEMEQVDYQVPSEEKYHHAKYVGVQKFVTREGQYDGVKASNKDSSTKPETASAQHKNRTAKEFNHQIKYSHVERNDQGL